MDLQHIECAECRSNAERELSEFLKLKELPLDVGSIPILEGRSRSESIIYFVNNLLHATFQLALHEKLFLVCVAC